MKRTFLPILLFYSTLCHAIYSDEQLYNAFLRQDMATWRAYIDQAGWDSLSKEERKRLLNYEYGYVATILETDPDTAKFYLDRFRAHVQEEHEKKHISEAHFCMYMSSIHAYDYMLDKSRLFSSGLQSFKLVKKAANLAPNDPFVLTLKANVDFYAPAAFGGDKEKALQMFARARSLFREQHDCRFLWNYASLRMCIAQCYEQTGDRQKAIDECQDILQEIPNFTFIRDTYLPQLVTSLNDK